MIRTLEEDNRIELSPISRWDGFQDHVYAMQPIFRIRPEYCVESCRLALDQTVHQDVSLGISPAHQYGWRE